MFSDRTATRIAGVLFIIATVSSSAGFVLLDPVLDDADLMASVATNETRIVIAGFLLLLDAIAVVIIPVLLFPIFRRRSETMARLYPVSRVVESVVLVIAVVGLLGLVTLSREYGDSSSDAASLDVSSTALLGVYEWGALLGIMLFFGMAGLLLNAFLFQTRLVPRWLSVWGLLSVALLPIEGVFEAFEATGLGFMSAPFAVQEMVFAVWLIVRGLDSFPTPADADRSGSIADRATSGARA